jgi:Carboxypeptidase regulatory-like domain
MAGFRVVHHPGPDLTVCNYSHGWWLSFPVLVGTLFLLACPREIREDRVDVASLNLACQPIAQGVQCQLLALSRNGTLPPRDVTSLASWHMGGSAQMHLSSVGMQVNGDGDTIIETNYQSKTARIWIRLTPNRPGQLLATVRGGVYASDRGRLNPLANARVEVVSGPSVGKQTTTRDDGSYELPAVVPGEIVIRAAKIGFVPTDLTAQIWPGDNRISLAIAIEASIKSWDF